LGETRALSRIPIVRRFPLLLWLALLVTPTSVNSAPSSWWTEEQTRIIDPTAAEDNYAAANLGQLKHVATQAKKHLDAFLPGQAGSAISTMVGSFEPAPGVTYTTQQLAVIRENNHAPANLGQLKALAKPFYDRLNALGFPTTVILIARGYPSSWAHDYPWDPSTPPSENYTPVNIGQMKMVFSFDLAVDSDDDELPDWWEIGYLGHIGHDPNGDYDGDGRTNAEELSAGTDPGRAPPAIYLREPSGAQLVP